MDRNCDRCVVSNVEKRSLSRAESPTAPLSNNKLARAGSRSPTSTPPQAIVLHAKDNVATALMKLPAGARVRVGSIKMVVSDKISFGHKFALQNIATGQPVIKYGETIGLAKRPIAKGDHVHRHNVDHRVEEIIFRMREET